MNDDRALSSTAAFSHEAGAFEGAVEPSRTYADLISYVASRSDYALPEQQERNRASALQKFLKHLEIAPDSIVGPEFGAGLDDALTAFVKAQKAEGLKDASIANTRSAIRKWAKYWRALVECEAAPKFSSFYEALRYYVDLNVAAGKKVNLSALSRRHGMPANYVPQVLSKKPRTFAANKIDGIAKMEVELGAPPTALTRFAALPGQALPTDGQKTEYGTKITELQLIPYRLKELPPSLLKEFRDLVYFKTATRPPHGFVRNLKWRTKKLFEFGGTGSVADAISLDGKTFSASAQVMLGFVKKFFGVMEAKGYDPAQFSLAWMCDLKLIDEVIEFGAERMGAVTQSTISMLENVRALLYKTGGWLYQQPAFSSRLHVREPMDKDQWQAWCNTRHAEIGDVIAQMEKDGLVRSGRDTMASIKAVLERDHPITALIEIVEGMERYHKKYESQPKVLHGITKAVLQRDILIFKIMIPQPLRVRMLKIMTWKEDNTGNLYRRNNGQWGIRFKTDDFKNEKGAAKDKPYDVPLPASLSAEIEYYLQSVRPLFKTKSDFAFVPDVTTGKAKRADRRTQQGSEWLNQMIRRRSRNFLAGCPGFGPHAFRHIVATDYIQNNPGSYFVAAAILHDKLATVMKAYAHLKAADGHRVYQDYLAGVTLAWRQS